MGLLLFFFFVSILFSFLCSIWEAVLLSITPSYINRQKQKGTQLGRDLEHFKEDIDRPLSAILTLNTIAHTVGAIGVGAQAGKIFGTHHVNLGVAELSYESIIAAVMTLAILVLSEIIPKTIGANLWEQLAPFTVKSLRILVFVLKPFVWLSQLITKTLKKDKKKSVFSRADFFAMAQAGEEAGTLQENESAIIKNLMRFDSIEVKDIMTPRTVMVTADESTTLKDFFEGHSKLRFSRIPIYKGSSDHITGFVLKDEILERLVQNYPDLTLGEIRKEIMAVAANKKLPQLFEALMQNRAHLAVVADEFGSIVGLVTMEDVLETLLGLEIMDELDAVADLQELARKSWEERAKKLGIIE